MKIISFILKSIFQAREVTQSCIIVDYKLSKPISPREFILFQRAKESWKDLSTLLMEERFKAEERKEILGEEWRKIAKIFDRFLLVLFTASSLIATICCIMMSPHFPQTDKDETEDDVFDQPELLVETETESYHGNASYLTASVKME